MDFNELRTEAAARVVLEQGIVAALQVAEWLAMVRDEDDPGPEVGWRDRKLEQLKSAVDMYLVGGHGFVPLRD